MASGIAVSSRPVVSPFTVNVGRSATAWIITAMYCGGVVAASPVAVSVAVAVIDKVKA